MLIDAPDPVFLFTAGQVHEEHTVEAFSTGELRRQLRDVVACPHEKHGAFVIVEPGEQRAEHARGDAGVGLARTRSPGESLLDLVAEEHAGGHGIGELEGLADVAFRLADQGAEEIPDVEDHRGPAGLVAQGFGKLALAAAGRRQEQDTAGTLAGLGLTLTPHGP